MPLIQLTTILAFEWMKCELIELPEFFWKEHSLSVAMDLSKAFSVIRHTFHCSKKSIVQFDFSFDVLWYNFLDRIFTVCTMRVWNALGTFSFLIRFTKNTSTRWSQLICGFIIPMFIFQITKSKPKNLIGIHTKRLKFTLSYSIENRKSCQTAKKIGFIHELMCNTHKKTEWERERDTITRS